MVSYESLSREYKITFWEALVLALHCCCGDNLTFSS